MQTITRGLQCHAHGIRGEGDPSKGVMLVGVAPGRDEMVSGRPRTGQAGRLMDAILLAAGIKREELYITNLMCWNQPKPEPHEWVECLARLDREIAEFQPKLIITCGNIPTDAILGAQRHKGKTDKSGAGDRGVTYWDSVRHAYILPTWEPAAVLYSQSVELVSDLLRDFQKIETILTWPHDGSVGQDVSYEVVRDVTSAQRVLDTLPRDGRYVALDIETTSVDLEVIDAESDQLLCIGLGYRTDDACERVYVLTAQACENLLWPTDVRWTFQYGQFDTYGIQRYLGVTLPIVDDTVGLSYCRDERPGRHSLKTQAREYLNSGWYEEGIDRRHLDAVDPATVYEYNAHDVAYTLRLAYLHAPAVRAEEMEPFYRTIFIPAVNVFRDSQAWGMRLDVNRLEELNDSWYPRRMEIEAEIVALAEREGFMGELNPRSHVQLSKMFFQILGFEPTQFSKKTKKPSTNKYALDVIDHPLAAKIRELRTYDVVLGLVLNFLQNMKSDDRIHSQPRLHGAVTGRMSYTDPPIHGLPQAYMVGDELAKLSECITASNEEWEIAKADYEQLEVWMAYDYSRDEQLLADLLSGDIHSATAESTFNVRREDFGGVGTTAWNQYRQDAKKVRFGIGYGESAAGLSTPRPKGIGRPIKECQAAIDGFWSRYPQHRLKTIEWERSAANDGVLVSASGRKRRFPLVLDPRQLRQAINFPIQATATDYGITSAIELHPLLAQYNAHLLFLWHDALVIEYPKIYRATVLPILKEIMERPRFPGFSSVRVEIKVGQNLGIMEKVKV